MRATALDEIEAAHAAVGGHGPGRRYATQQINNAYAMLLSSQFQGFCRALHSEAVDVLVNAITPAALQQAVRIRFTDNRKLDQGNPNPGNLGSDFGRFQFNFWNDVNALEAANLARQALLQELCEWRNAIAHQQFDPAKLGGRTTLQLGQVRRWRGACNGLARSFDQAMSARLAVLVGHSPW